MTVIFLAVNSTRVITMHFLPFTAFFFYWNAFSDRTVIMIAFWFSGDVLGLKPSV
jgi:hypothetical protein